MTRRVCGPQSAASRDSPQGTVAPRPVAGPRRGAALDASFILTCGTTAPSFFLGELAVPVRRELQAINPTPAGSFGCHGVALRHPVAGRAAGRSLMAAGVTTRLSGCVTCERGRAVGRACGTPVTETTAVGCLHPRRRSDSGLGPSSRVHELKLNTIGRGYHARGGGTHGARGRVVRPEARDGYARRAGRRSPPPAPLSERQCRNWRRPGRPAPRS